MNLRKAITESVQEALKSVGLPEVDFQLEHPSDMAHGDYAVNVAMVGFDKAKSKFKSPRELAEKIVAKLGETNLKKLASEIKVEGPGFINISIQNKVIITQVDDMLMDKKGKNGLKGVKIMVEYTDPNPFKEMHIGHLYSNIVGESLCRLFESQGAQVRRACYQGDVGMHVAKSVWGMQQKLTKENLKLPALAKKDLNVRQKFMGEAYALGAKAYEEDKNAAEAIKTLNKKIYEGDKEIADIYQLGRTWSLEYFEQIYQRLGTKFDDYYFESQVGPQGLKLVKKYLKKGVFEKSQGAVIFKGEKHGLHTRVFISKQGLPTYEAKDLGLAPIKFKKFKFDRSLIITANEIDDYFKVVLKALAQILPDLAQKTSHISHGMVKLPEGKMSSRKGNVLTAEWLLNEAEKYALKAIKREDLTKGQKDQVAEMVGEAAVKYALLKTSIGLDVVFDIDQSVSFEGNSGPYLQYTYARCRSVLAKAKDKGKLTKVTDLSQSEAEVLRTVYRFEEVVSQATEELSPNLVANFLHDLAQKYNTFYNQESILKAESHKREFRLWLTMVTGEVIKKGLYLLGIEAPERM